MSLRILVLTGLLVLACIARADDAVRYNQVHLQAQQSRAVSNDTMHVTLNTYADMQDAAALAERINRDMEWALARASAFAGVKVSTGAYQTWPVYRENIKKGWRGQQSLVLESTDTKGLSQLAGQLQEKLQIKSMNFSVSDERRTEVENSLIRMALDAFKQRAGIVGDNLQATGYRLVDININTSSQRPPVVYQARAMALEAAAPVAAEAGESDIQVTVNGTIELLVP
ncbi:MAG: SIMPL domain-containing protein [Gammaproteobacteria bacterium]